MIITETETGVDLTGVDLLSDDVGGIWDSFKLSITEANAKRLVDGYNLIRITLPDIYLSQHIMEILLDESADAIVKKDTLLNLIATNIINILKRLGFTINTDLVQIKHIDVLIRMLDLFTILDGYEDLLSLSTALESKDSSPEDRFINVYQILYMDNVADEEIINDIIEDVSEVTLETLRLSLVLPELEVVVPENIITRIKVNKDALTGTLTETHIRNNGVIGSPFEGLLEYYKKELSAIKEIGTYQYCKELLCLLLLSEVNNDNIITVYNEHTTEMIDDVSVSFQLDKFINGITL